MPNACKSESVRLDPIEWIEPRSSGMVGVEP